MDVKGAQALSERLAQAACGVERESDVGRVGSRVAESAVGPTPSSAQLLAVRPNRVLSDEPR
jgi:hypothetical protein